MPFSISSMLAGFIIAARIAFNIFAFDDVSFV
ncbi:hypothetical protein ZBT109_0941 [Zymobacter palmae]|uniref:Uncharacterized protein n=1 Tax=Zymobacter palmae TaxID=33074 RepID=A0A348HDL2_9GAMM|nr:hypothetical protein ZBT109_0941 [Zymobacter palmae]